MAGIIAAQDANDIGVVGIAPRAELASYNTLGSGGSGAYVQSFAADYDVANHSWGITFRGIEYLRIGQIERDAIAQAVREGRGGRGSVLVKAAGNSGAGSARARGVLAYINAFGNHHSSGLDGHNALPEILTVGAVRASGEENVDSEGGSNVLLSAYWNLPCRYYPNSEHLFAVVNPVGIVTTDLVGDFGHTWGVEPVFISAVNNTPSTFLGGSQALLRELLPSLGNAIEVEPLANTNDYQYCFNGTSAATPQVTGAVALMLQARPQLSWRDVRAILAETARQSDADNPQWAINGAGLSYHPHHRLRRARHHRSRQPSPHLDAVRRRRNRTSTSPTRQLHHKQLHQQLLQRSTKHRHRNNSLNNRNRATRLHRKPCKRK